MNDRQRKIIAYMSGSRGITYYKKLKERFGNIDLEMDMLKNSNLVFEMQNDGRIVYKLTDMGKDSAEKIKN